jgi:hypothetical protein
MRITTGSAPKSPDRGESHIEMPLLAATSTTFSPVCGQITPLSFRRRSFSCMRLVTSAGNSRTRSFLMRCTCCNVCVATGTHVHVSFRAKMRGLSRRGCGGGRQGGIAQGVGDRAWVRDRPGCGAAPGWGTPPATLQARASDGDVLCRVAVKLKGGLPYEQVFIADGPGVAIAGG